MQVQIVTPGSADTMPTSPDGADEQDGYSTPVVEGPAASPAGRCWTDPALYSPPSTSIWEMMCLDSPLSPVPKALVAPAIPVAATAELPGTAAASSGLDSPVDVAASDTAEASLGSGSLIATAPAATAVANTTSPAAAVALYDDTTTASALNPTATAARASMASLAPAGPQEAVAPHTTTTAQQLHARGMLPASCLVSQPRPLSRIGLVPRWCCYWYL